MGSPPRPRPGLGLSGRPRGKCPRTPCREKPPPPRWTPWPRLRRVLWTNGRRGPLRVTRHWPIAGGHDRRKAGRGRSRRLGGGGAHSRTHSQAMVVVASAQSPAAGAPKVLLLSGQPAAAAAAAGAPAGRNVPLMLPGQRGASSEAESGGPPLARKRQRLTHLSPEEKALRRWARGPGLRSGPKPGQGALGLDRAALGRRRPGGCDASVARGGAGQEVGTGRFHRAPWSPGCRSLFYFLLFCLMREDA